MTSLPADHALRLHRAKLALDGLSVGDALGETCFRSHNYYAVLEDPKATTRGPWPWTDDTAMALGLFEIIEKHGCVDQDALARRFAARFKAQPWRGYGAGARTLLQQVGEGMDWRIAAECILPGGSYGNGSAMRIAPLAAYFAEDDYSHIADQARLSAGVTHAHPEGLAGAISTAIAGAYAWRNRNSSAQVATKRGLIETVLSHTPQSRVRRGIELAVTLEFELSIETVTSRLGNGRQISCQDTVPFCMWVAANHLNNYEQAILQTIRAGGDIDTNCAIVGGIVSLSVGAQGIPVEWLNDREELVI